MNSIKPDLKLSVYCTAIAEGGQKEWFFAFDQYRQTDSDTEMVVLLSALTCSKEPWILHTYVNVIVFVYPNRILLQLWLVLLSAYFCRYIWIQVNTAADYR